MSQKIESVYCYSYPQAKLCNRFLSFSSRQKGIAHSSRTVFFEDIFFLERKRERIIELKKIPKLTKVSVTSLDKFHHLCNLYIFGLCFVMQKFSFKHEVGRFFNNLTNKIFTKKYDVQELLHEIYNLVLPYFLTISATICQIKSV